jgi:hypothetical protein
MKVSATHNDPVRRILDRYNIEIYFRKPGFTSSHSEGLDKTPNLEHYKSETINHHISIEPHQDIYHEVIKDFPDEAYIHVIELQRQLP